MVRFHPEENSVSATDWVVLMGAILSGISGIYFPWRQNKIFERQNEVLAKQEGIPSVSDSRSSNSKTHWPILTMGVFVVMM